MDFGGGTLPLRSSRTAPLVTGFRSLSLSATGPPTCSREGPILAGRPASPFERPPACKVVLEPPSRTQSPYLALCSSVRGGRNAGSRNQVRPPASARTASQPGGDRRHPVGCGWNFQTQGPAISPKWPYRVVLSRDSRGRGSAPNDARQVTTESLSMRRWQNSRRCSPNKPPQDMEPWTGYGASHSRGMTTTPPPRNGPRRNLFFLSLRRRVPTRVPAAQRGPTRGASHPRRMLAELTNEADLDGENARRNEENALGRTSHGEAEPRWRNCWARRWGTSRTFMNRAKSARKAPLIDDKLIRWPGARSAASRSLMPHCANSSLHNRGQPPWHRNGISRRKPQHSPLA